MTPKEFIKSKQNDVLLNDYTLQEMEWFMAEFAKQEVSEQLLIQRVSGSASDFYTDLMKLINAHCKKGLSMII